MTQPGGTMRQVASLPHVLSIRPISLTCSRRMTSHNVRSSRAPASNHRHIPSVPCRVTAAAGPRPEGISHRHDDTPAALADSWKAINFFLATLAACPPALADTGVTYNPQDGSETLKTVAGVGYIILVIIYFFRLFKKRADKATSERIASSGSDADAEEDSDDEEEAEQPVDDVTPLQCFIGFAQAGVICYLLYLLSTNVDAFFAKQELPMQYTARNISVLVATVARGLVYLITFVFGANSLGLAALGVQMIVDPEAVRAAEGGRRRSPSEQLPKVKLTDDIFAIRRAFKEAEEMGKRSVERAKKDTEKS